MDPNTTKIYKCELCQKEFKDPSGLRKHKVKRIPCVDPKIKLYDAELKHIDEKSQIEQKHTSIIEKKDQEIETLNLEITRLRTIIEKNIACDISDIKDKILEVKNKILDYNDDPKSQDQKLYRLYNYMMTKQSHLFNEFIQLAQQNNTVDHKFKTSFLSKINKIPRSISNTIKKQIAGEQGQKCKHCDMTFKNTYEVDHIKPLYLGGDNQRLNLQALCTGCHSEKTSNDENEFVFTLNYLYDTIKGC